MGIIKKFQDNGIYTLVEMHQDVWAAQICGHGAPLVMIHFLILLSQLFSSSRN